MLKYTISSTVIMLRFYNGDITELAEPEEEREGQSRFYSQDKEGFKDIFNGE